MIADFAIRGLMHEAALKADEDPDRLSFLHAVRVIRRKLPRFAAIPPASPGFFRTTRPSITVYIPCERWLRQQNDRRRGARPPDLGTDAHCGKLVFAATRGAPAGCRERNHVRQDLPAKLARLLRPLIPQDDSPRTMATAKGRSQGLARCRYG